MLKVSYCQKNKIVTIKMDIVNYKDFDYEIENSENECLSFCFAVNQNCQDAINSAKSQYPLTKGE